MTDGMPLLQYTLSLIFAAELVHLSLKNKKRSVGACRSMRLSLFSIHRMGALVVFDFSQRVFLEQQGEPDGRTMGCFFRNK
jgi:hypothetical protein